LKGDFGIREAIAEVPFSFYMQTVLKCILKSGLSAK